MDFPFEIWNWSHNYGAGVDNIVSLNVHVHCRLNFHLRFGFLRESTICYRYRLLPLKLQLLRPKLCCKISVEWSIQIAKYDICSVPARGGEWVWGNVEITKWGHSAPLSLSNDEYLIFTPPSSQATDQHQPQHHQAREGRIEFALAFSPPPFLEF